VLKGGGSGDAVVAGRASTSLLYRAVAREDGAPQMPLGQPKLPDAEINVIRDWIQQGLLENAGSQPRGPIAVTLDYTPTALHRPEGPPPIPGSLPRLQLAQPDRAHPVTALAASPWAPVAAIAGHERIYLYNVERKIIEGELAFPEGIPYVLHFSADGGTLLAGGGRGVQTGIVALYDVRTGKRLATIGHETDIVLAADLSPDGKLVALGGPGRIVKVYRISDGQLVYQLTRHTDWITAVAFSPDASRLATADRAGGILLWDSTAGGSAGTLAEHKDSVTSLAWRGDGRLLASGGEDGEIVIWNVEDGFPVATIAKAHTPKSAPGSYGVVRGGVLSVDFTADGRLVSVGRDSVIRLWTTDGKPKSASAAYDALLTKVAACAGGKVVIAGDDLGRVHLWESK
jgi:WD40 repeat protein